MKKNSLEHVKDFYNHYNYPDGYKKRKVYWKEHLSKHIDFNDLKGKKILDVGCGQGTISKVLYDAGADVYSIDLSKTSVNQVKKNYPEIKAKVGNALDLDFPDNFFDIVLSIGVLHHTPDPYKGFKECVRVTKPNGKMVILLYTKYHYYPLVYKTLKILFRNKKPEEVPKLFIKLVKRFTEHYYKEKRTDQDAIQLIADQFFTPIANFYSRYDIKRWAKKDGLKLLSTSETYFKQHRIYTFEKSD
tara:strand:- start:967 stop:1701 length:735 start_codon:yes stop_codon:yes gene_type:complete